VLSDQIGVKRNHGDRMMIRTRRPEVGHAVYGPYVQAVPGSYRVDFRVALLDWTSDPDSICVRLDVATDSGRLPLAEQALCAGDLARKFGTFPLTFQVPAACELEFRVFVYGTAELMIADEPQLTCLETAAAEESAAVSQEE
jgi:hypothetical protein